MNKEEASDLVGKRSFSGLHALGPKIVCITDGANGNQASDGKKIYFVGARKIKVVERTGAGDAFASGFVACLIKTGKIEDAVRIGSLNAESVIKIRGAKNGLLGWGRARREMGKIKVKIGKL